MPISQLSNLMSGLTMGPGNPNGPQGSPLGSIGGGSTSPVNMPMPGGGGSAADGLGQINTGAGTVGSALSRASAALGTGGGGGMVGAGMNPFKKGGKVSTKGRDWHGFGSSKTGNNNHGF